jgi:hypothetical protein
MTAGVRIALAALVGLVLLGALSVGSASDLPVRGSAPAEWHWCGSPGSGRSCLVEPLVEPEPVAGGGPDATLAVDAG